MQIFSTEEATKWNEQRTCEIHSGTFIITNHQRRVGSIIVFKLVAKFRTRRQKKCYIHIQIQRDADNSLETI